MEFFTIKKYVNKKKTIRENERKRSKEKEKDLTSVKVLDKHQEIYNEISLNNKNNSNKNIIYRINSQQNNSIKDLAKYIKKKMTIQIIKIL